MIFTIWTITDGDTELYGASLPPFQYSNNEVGTTINPYCKETELCDFDSMLKAAIDEWATAYSCNDLSLEAIKVDNEYNGIEYEVHNKLTGRILATVSCSQSVSYTVCEPKHRSEINERLTDFRRNVDLVNLRLCGEHTEGLSSIPVYLGENGRFQGSPDNWKPNDENANDWMKLERFLRQSAGDPANIRFELAGRAEDGSALVNIQASHYKDFMDFNEPFKVNWPDEFIEKYSELWLPAEAVGVDARGNSVDIREKYGIPLANIDKKYENTIAELQDAERAHLLFIDTPGQWEDALKTFIENNYKNDYKYNYKFDYEKILISLGCSLANGYELSPLPEDNDVPPAQYNSIYKNAATDDYLGFNNRDEGLTEKELAEYYEVPEEPPLDYMDGENPTADTLPPDFDLDALFTDEYDEDESEAPPRFDCFYNPISKDPDYSRYPIADDKGLFDDCDYAGDDDR